MKKGRAGVFIAIALVVVAFIVFIRSQFTTNFGFLGLLFLVGIIALPLLYHTGCLDSVERRSTDGTNLRIGILDNLYAFFAAVLLLVLGWFCVKTLNNYFYADKHVYRNIDHHAVKFSGIKIAEPRQFVLAGNSRNAFFDDERMNGQATILDVEDSAVVVRLTGFTRPIYFNKINDKKRCTEQNLVNVGSMLSFRDGEHLQMRLNNDSIYDFSIGNLTKDSVEYFISLNGEQPVKSNEDRFMIFGLPMAKLAQNPRFDETNFTGIHIVRNTIYPLVLQDDKIQRYKDVPYSVDIQNFIRNEDRSYVEAIRVGEGEWHSINATTDITIRIPFEQAFVIGYGESGTRPVYFTRTEGRLALKYLLPVYRYFEQTPEKSFNNVCVTTTLSSFMDNIDIMPENILLFDVFSHPDNINNMSPMTLSYVSGPTNQRLQFLYTSHNQRTDTIRAGESFAGTEAPLHRGVEWIASVEDFKETSPYQPTKIKWYVILFALSLSVLLYIGAHSVKDEYSALYNTFTSIEFVAYAVTLFLVTFRWFLLWRTSVFIPVENITYYEFFGIFRNPENGLRLTQMMVLLIVVIFIAKMVLRYKFRLADWSLPGSLWFHSLWGVVSLVLLALCYVWRHSYPCIVIPLPVLIFLFNTILIYKKYGGIYRKDDRDWDNLEFNDPPIQSLFWSVVNSLGISVVLLLIDSGYGILFLTFSLFWFSWLLHEHVTSYLHESVGLMRRNWMVLLLFGVMLALVACYKNIIGIIYYSSVKGAIIMAVAGAFIGFSVFYILNWRNKVTHAVWVIVLSLLFAGSVFGFKQYISNWSQHTAQRIAVHFEDPGKAMREIEDSQTEYRFLQASLNHMIIGEYSRRGENVSLFGEHGYGYFKMQPHSKVGAMWNAQLTDISLVRFVIAEHSPKLPYLIVAFFLMMLVWAVRQPLYRRWTRAVLLQIPLLLMVQSLLIWMATTQRFIFLGQDFPMISINSRLTLVFYFNLIIIWIVVAIYSKVTFVDVYDSQCNPDTMDKGKIQRNSFRYVVAKNDMWKISTIMLICMFMGYVSPKGKSEPTLQLTALMNELSAKIGDVNRLLEDYQNTHHQRTNGRLPQNQSLTNLNSYIKAFNTEMSIDSLFKDFPFGKRIWERYVNKDSKDNNVHQVLHAHLNGKHQLELRLVDYFYNSKLPEMKENEWRGNIVSTNDSVPVTRYDLTEGDLTAYRLPAEWMSDGKEKTIVSCINSQILGSEPNFVMRRGIRSAAAIGNGITLNHPNRDRLNSSIEYLARNVMLNGHRTMFYPMGESLYWIKNFADELKSQKSDIKAEERPADFNSDVRLTLLPDMSNTIFNILRDRGAQYSSVIVANGDGAVWAMPSYDRRYHLNPNDYKHINRMRDSLSLYGAWGGLASRHAFGNQNLMSIPFGPGSSQKPLVWTAVASRVNYRHWADLCIRAYHNNYPTASKGKYNITHFNGMRFLGVKPFAPLLGDENHGRPVTLRGYMRHSSNVYNALMAYIGSFDEAELSRSGMLDIAATHDGQTMFARASENLPYNEYVQRFPLMGVGSSTFSFNRKPVSANQGSSILEQSMHDMFFRNNEDDEIRKDAYSNPANGLLKADPANRHVSFAFVERSHFDTRQGHSEEEFMENAIRSTAIGAQKVWNISPWKMAESYGRMASLNRNLHFNVLRQKERPAYEQFAQLSDGYWNARPEQLKGMSDVVSPSGTAFSVATSLGSAYHNGGNDDSNRVGQYYIYAKTGTIGEGDQHRFGVIIANRDLMKTNAQDLQHVRFVLLYFTFSSASFATYAEVIRQVISTVEFEQYMRQ